MIGLSDAAMQRLLDAAKKVPRRRRGAWLLDVTARLEANKNNPGARRVRAWRRRQKRTPAGYRPRVSRFYLTAKPEQTIDFLISKGCLADKPEHTRREVDSAVSVYWADCVLKQK
jgi:hypothetical protein